MWSRQLVLYSFDSKAWKTMLKSPSKVEAALKAAKPAPSAKKLKSAMPWIEKIIAGVKAVDSDTDDLERDKEDYFASFDSYLAYRWLCGHLMTGQPIMEMFWNRTIAIYDFYGYSEVLRRFPCPFPIPQGNDQGRVLGYIPNAKLKNLKLMPIPADRLAQIIEILEEPYVGRPKKKTQDKVATQDGSTAYERLLERVRQLWADMPEKDEIEIAHADFKEIAFDVYESGDDLFGIII